MGREDEIVLAITNLTRKVDEGFSNGNNRFDKIDEKFDGDGGLNEGVVPMLKRHDKELSGSLKKDKQGIWKWIEEHPNTIKYGIIIYTVIFHGALIAKLLKFI